MCIHSLCPMLQDDITTTCLLPHITGQVQACNRISSVTCVILGYVFSLWVLLGIIALVMQVTDVSQFGDVSSAKSLFVPRGSRLVGSHLEKTEPGQRDTGTVAGVVPLPPQTFYRHALCWADSKLQGAHLPCCVHAHISLMFHDMESFACRTFCQQVCSRRCVSGRSTHVYL